MKGKKIKTTYGYEYHVNGVIYAIVRHRGNVWTVLSKERIDEILSSDLSYLYLSNPNYGMQFLDLKSAILACDRWHYGHSVYDE